MTCTPQYASRFVNVYLIDRAYGGPEDGGWWYDCGKAVKSTQYATEAAAEAARAFRHQWCEEQNANRRSDISSVFSEGRYAVYIEDEPAADYPSSRPHYE